MLSRLRLILGTGVVLAFSVLSYASAQTAVQSYDASTPLQPGFIVQLSDKTKNTVQASTQTNANKIFGIVISPNDTPVTLSAPSSKQVFVATNGTFTVLVSNQNGPIKVGDYITISSLDGIGMKASDTDTMVLGKATTPFTGTGDSLGKAQLKGSKGSATVQLGRIAINIDITKNPLLVPAHNSLPLFLQKAGQSIASKPVSATRAYVGLLVLFISAVIAGSLLYGGVRSSIISIGRNPLSKRSIVRGLVQVTLTSLIIFIVGLFAVYLILRF